jgi:exopolyphosphatase/guanosine-5'-triphosphate,3'-diphosphate pyrophosphatase
MPRFAAIDVGSNALRLRVVECAGPAPEQRRELAAERVPVRLGRDVFLTGRLAPAALIEAVDALRTFRETLRAHGVDAWRAVATSAVREAANGEVLVERTEREAGLRLEIIEGVEEARLVLLAVTHALKLGERRALLVDIGGGSVELTLLEGGALRSSVSLPMGAVRLCEAFLDPEGPVTPERQALLQEYLERFLHEAPALQGPRPDLVVATGGNAEVVAQLCPRATADGPGVDVERMRALCEDLSKLSPKARRERYNLRGDRADVLVPALYVLGALSASLGLEELVTPGVGLKEGILAELTDRAFRVWDQRGEDEAIHAAALELGRRYRFDEAHGRQVSRLALLLFDQLAEALHLAPEDRSTLQLAALLHDIGDFVGYEAHHKHTGYLITHADLMGLSPNRKELVANVARYHRRALPDLSHPAYRKLDRKDRAVVRKLSALLRVADAFDREHQGKVEDIAVRLLPAKLSLRATGRGDLSLERWTAQRKADLLEDVLEREVRVDGAEGVTPRKTFTG